MRERKESHNLYVIRSIFIKNFNIEIERFVNSFLEFLHHLQHPVKTQYPSLKKKQKKKKK